LGSQEFHTTETVKGKLKRINSNGSLNSYLIMKCIALPHLCDFQFIDYVTVLVEWFSENC